MRGPTLLEHLRPLTQLFSTLKKGGKQGAFEMSESLGNDGWKKEPTYQRKLLDLLFLLVMTSS